MLLVLRGFYSFMIHNSCNIVTLCGIKQEFTSMQHAVDNSQILFHKYFRRGPLLL